MLERAVQACPEPHWSDRTRNPEFWYTAFHTLFWLDLYLSPGQDGFAPPAPFTLDELDPAGVLPERVYTQSELLLYLEHGREKARRVISSLDDERVCQRHSLGKNEFSGLELLLYNFRHVQHHAAQLHLILRQVTDSTPGYSMRASTAL
jgi:DinB superfamily